MSEVNYAVLGKKRKQRIAKLEAHGVPIKEEWRNQWDLANMEDEAFQLLLEDEGDDDALTPEMKLYIENLEKKVDELANAGINESAIDALVEKKIKEVMAAQSKGDPSETVIKGITEALNNLSETTARSQPYQTSRPITREQVDVDDVLDEDVYFFAYRSQYTILGDKRQGQDIRNPYGMPIKFAPSFRTVKNKASRYDKSVIAVCSAKISSKKILAFLESHTLFNVTFFKNAKQAATVDSHLAEILASVAQEVSGLTQHEVITRARSMGITMDQNTDVVKRALIEAVSQQRVRAASTKTSNIHPTANMIVADDEGKNEKTVALPD